MTDTQDPLWRALARLEHTELSDDERNLLRPAFAAMHGSQPSPRRRRNRWRSRLDGGSCQSSRPRAWL